MPAVGIGKHAPGTPLAAMIDNHHVKAAAEKIVSQFGVLNVAFNTTRTDHHDPVVTFGAEAHKAHRNVIHARKFSLFPLTPEIG